MEISVRRVILDAAIDRSVIRGAISAPTGERRDFYGWLELSAALEMILDPGADHERDSRATSGVMTDPRFEKEDR
jgi:hypothetical protein